MSTTRTTTKKQQPAALPRGERKRRPSHPGMLLREMTVPATGLTQAQLAERLGVSRRSINMVLNEQRPVTVDMAHRLARVFGNSPQFWLNMQQAVDVWDAFQENRREYERIDRLPNTQLQVA